MAKVIVVQPWFTAVGHPAQSLLNTAMALRDVDNLGYLVSAQNGRSSVQLDAMRQIAVVDDFKVSSPSLREGTLKALLRLCRLASQGKRFGHMFFFDVHLVLLAAVWNMFYLYLRPQRLSLIYLMGPERIQRSRIASVLVTRFLKRFEVILFLRTEELAAAWRLAFPTVSPSTIRYLPSLELPDNYSIIEPPVAGSHLKFGVFGQIRHGKGLDWLVPMFENEPELGELTVAGTFNNPQDAQSMAFLQAFDGFRNEYLNDETMLAIARQQHYLLMLYDNWDARMESAVLYLAARAGRPVIAYDNGWCGRQVRQFGNGLLATQNHAELPALIKSLPLPGSEEYEGLLSGVERFRQAHSAGSLREQYLQELMN